MDFYTRQSKRSGHISAPIHNKKARQALQAIAKRQRGGDSLEPIRVFSTQQAAFDYIHANPSRVLHLFARELNEYGKREFLVTSIRSFTRFYSKIQSACGANQQVKSIHYYEVIRDHFPCRLYFDLEFAKAPSCPELDDAKGLELVAQLVHATLQYVKAWFGKVGKSLVQDSDMADKRFEKCIVLDSCTDTKFSCHLIFPQFIFENNRTAGIFVKKLVEVTPSLLIPQPIQAEDNNDSDKTEKALPSKHLVDTSVYSRNRCFRLLGSSKYGKPTALRHCEVQLQLQDKTWLAAPQETFSQQAFLQSLVAFIPDDQSQDFLETCSHPSIFPVLATNPLPAGQVCHGTTTSTAPWPQAETMQGYAATSSPFPEADEFVAKLIHLNRDLEYPELPRIDRWMLLSGNRIRYNISGGYRYCANIQRHHKSNRVSIVTDLIHMVWYQTCFDANCAGYRSHTMPLPQSLFQNRAANCDRGHTIPFDE